MQPSTGGAGAKSVQPGANALNAADKTLGISNRFPSLKIEAQGLFTFTDTGASQAKFIVYNHNLGYVPFWVIFNVVGAESRPTPGEVGVWVPGNSMGTLTTGGGTCAMSETSLAYFPNSGGDVAGTVSFYYYIYRLPITPPVTVGLPSTGTMTVSNAGSSLGVTFPAGTVFENNGLLWTANSTFTVPGATFGSGGTTVTPGTIVIAVTSRYAGTNYNVAAFGTLIGPLAPIATAGVGYSMPGYFDAGQQNLVWGVGSVMVGGTGTATGYTPPYLLNTSTISSTGVPQQTYTNKDAGFKVAGQGNTATSADLRDYTVHSSTRSPLVGYVTSEQSTTPSNDANSLSGVMTLVTHNFGYSPLVYGFITDPSISSTIDAGYYLPAQFSADNYVLSGPVTAGIYDIRNPTPATMSLVVLKDPFK